MTGDREPATTPSGATSASPDAVPAKTPSGTTSGSPGAVPVRSSALHEAPTAVLPRALPSTADPHDRLCEALAGVRAVLLDMDGVVVLRGRPIEGAGAAVASLRARGIPFRFLTNSSLWSRDSLAARLSGAGIVVAADEIVTALSATAALAARRWHGRRLYVLAAPDGLREFDGQWLIGDDEASAAARDESALGRNGSGLGPPQSAVARDGSAPVAAVIIGDAGPGFTYERLNIAFRLVRSGARLVAVHRNRWWLTPDGETIDSGAFVRALEYACGRRSLLVGKPSPAFFFEALASLWRAGGPVAGDPALDRRDVLMVGDDLQSDVAAARHVGLRGAFVLSGKHGPRDLELARRRGRQGLPDAVAPSLAEIVVALG